jgi:hypothetical protein
MRTPQTEDEAIGDLVRRFVATDPLQQLRKRYSANEIAGAIALAWHRGRQAGALEAHAEIAEHYPAVRKLKTVLGYSTKEETRV